MSKKKTTKDKIKSTKTKSTNKAGARKKAPAQRRNTKNNINNNKVVVNKSAKKRKNKTKTHAKTTAKKQQPEFPHFRFYKPSNHPALIVGEHSMTEYKYHKTSHSDKDGNDRADEISPNPNPKDDQPMYIYKRTRHAKKNKFREKLPWKVPEKYKK